MKIDDILKLKEAGFSIDEIMTLAPNIHDAPATVAAQIPEPMEPAAPAAPAAPATDPAVLEAINKLTDIVRAGNRGSSGSAAAAPTVDASSIFETIINGINKGV